MLDTAKIAAEHIAGHTVWTLAGIADVHSPDTVESPGAKFLMGVRDDVVEAIEYANALIEMDSEAAQQAADNGPSIYTHELWQQFVDLCAYQEDLSEWGELDATDLESVGRLALYVIAKRLVEGLIDGAIEYIDEQYGEV